ncbi:Putative diguanylate phosphodiesterase (EAL domain) [Thiobacillus denitrificans ATCC 25259]|uniref:Putative diguanylate phosphodiesterase (EAL domain) n=1 Tax=Thiobacillus denitrificans (strain ATCC 25259 / T1) TaxID=292415 RepID=Q3SEV6_THIDA|nr:EAL domain-containing protein [Thiobacillus denitrificans]AAZ97375.1 Putative diguanylate phosphodiesterase (EAL domain) [Thiobacillus denitrificans ATCC 25259]
MRTLLQDILARPRFTTLLQPVLDLEEGLITGYEALSHGPASTPLHAPQALVAAAVHSGLLTELDLACMRGAIRTFARLKLAGRLLLHVSPASLLDARFDPDTVSAALDAARIARSRLVVVIRQAEESARLDFPALDRAVSRLRATSIEVAVDGADDAAADLAGWREFRPFFVKARMRCVTSQRHPLAAGPTGGRPPHPVSSARFPLLAHGVESRGDLRLLKDLGIRYAQGDLIGCPSPVPIRLLPREVEMCLHNAGPTHLH